MHTAVIKSKRLVMQTPTPDDVAAVLDYHSRNREHLRPWEPRRDALFYSEKGMGARIAAMVAAIQAGTALHLLIRAESGGPVLGEIGFTNIVRGAFQACHLGFSLCEQAQGRGLMREAIGAALELMFGQYGLHRVMANYRPENVRSARLLESVGFEQEGLARSYLHIDGAWRDHVLTSLVPSQ